MNAIKTFCAVMAALVLSACGKSVDLSKPEFAVGAYWESLASDNVAQFLTTVGDSKEGKALDKESQVFFTERFDGSTSQRRMHTVKNGDSWRLKGAQSGASGFEAMGEAFDEALGNFGK